MTLTEAAAAVRKEHAALKAAHDRFLVAIAERNAAETALLNAQREVDGAERALVEAASPRVVVVDVAALACGHPGCARQRGVGCEFCEQHRGRAS